MRKRLLANRAENRVGRRRLRCPQPFRGGLGWGVQGEGPRGAGLGPPQCPRLPAEGARIPRAQPQPSPQRARSGAARRRGLKRRAAAQAPRARGPGEPWLCSLVLVSLLKAARRPGRSRPEPPRTVIYEAQGAGRRERSARGGGRRTPTPWLSPALPSGRLQPHEDPRPGRRAWRSPDRPLPRPWSLDRSVPWPGRAELKVGGGALARPLGSPRGRSPGHLRRGHPIARA